MTLPTDGVSTLPVTQTEGGKRGEVMVLEGIHKLISAAESEPANFPHTLLYNEGWLLRLVLDWYSRHKLTGNPLLFQHRATWFSEALLPSPFRPRHRGDPRAEARTHVDGIVGHFSIGRSGKADASLLADATQIIVIEAKIYSPLASGTRHAPSFDQAARNVACITELLSRANRLPSEMTNLAFFIMAPEVQIEAGVFTQKLDKAYIRAAVLSRAEAFAPELGSWVDEWFIPTLEAIRIETHSWESLIGYTASNDPETFQSLLAFYKRCLMHNGPGIRHEPTYR
jgi:hypothetical protein